MMSYRLSQTSWIRNAFRDASFGSESAFSWFAVDFVAIMDVGVERPRGDSGRMTRNNSMGGRESYKVVVPAVHALAWIDLS